MGLTWVGPINLQVECSDAVHVLSVKWLTAPAMSEAYTHEDRSESSQK